jgi:hypothetical protein
VVATSCRGISKPSALDNGVKLSTLAVLVTAATVP